MGVKAQINPVCKCSSVSHSNRWQSCLPNPCSNNGTCEPLVNGGYKCNCPADNPDQFGPNCQILAATYNGQGKVLSLLEACFDLISSPSLSMKIQIMGRKITENLGFKSPLRKVKKIFCLFSFHFQILHTKVDIFLISCLIN